MSRTLHMNRRTEPRHPRSSPFIGWRSRPATRHTALVHDVSASGLGFVVTAGHRPDVGEEIEVDWMRADTTEPYHVVRIQMLDEARTLVGCKQDAVDGVDSSPLPLPKLGQRVERTLRRSPVPLKNSVVPVK